MGPQQQRRHLAATTPAGADSDVALHTDKAGTSSGELAGRGGVGTLGGGCPTHVLAASGTLLEKLVLVGLGLLLRLLSTCPGPAARASEHRLADPASALLPWPGSLPRCPLTIIPRSLVERDHLGVHGLHASDPHHKLMRQAPGS